MVKELFQRWLIDYYFDQHQIGAVILEVVVNGKTTTLGPDYAVGAMTPGRDYTTVAAFIAPLSKGAHTVIGRVWLTGDAILEFFHLSEPGPVVELRYDVFVQMIGWRVPAAQSSRLGHSFDGSSICFL
jgi:hypothetical protein